MNADNDWSPDEPLGTEVFEQGDEALAEQESLTPGFIDAVQGDPSLDPTNVVDEMELEEAGVELDDPKVMLILSDGADDPDGLGGPPDSGARTRDDQGWDFDRSDSADDEEAQS